MNENIAAYNRQPAVSDLFYCEDTVDFLSTPEYFRPFSTGLTELLKKCDYPGSLSDIDEKADFLYKKLHSVNPAITQNTILGWFHGNQIPKPAADSRTLMYQICFAFHLPVNGVVWFFRHVYFDREFNFHNLNEAVYYYCISHHLPYCEAESILLKLSSAPKKESNLKNSLFADALQKKIDSFSSTDELTEFLKDNICFFFRWDKYAAACIAEMLDDLKKTKLQNASLLSVDAMLAHMFYTKTGLSKKTLLPDTIRINFPSRAVFSDILNSFYNGIPKADFAASYDIFRKVLILLKFYEYWHQTEPSADGVTACVYGRLCDTYIEETDRLLLDCGYNRLYAGNPYDWLFLYSSKMENPLRFLRDTLYYMEYGADEEDD